MPRFFIEVAYDGLKFSGFQKQNNAVTIQSKVEKALAVFYRRAFDLTGASRTDSGVHAYQNYFHFDDESYVENNNDLYSLNRILPHEIVIKKIFMVTDTMHCRFDAIERHYQYQIITHKNPFFINRAFYFPFFLDHERIKKSCKILLTVKNFQAFSKKNTQVYTYDCIINKVDWNIDHGMITFDIVSNRFLRGMVRGIVGTLLNIGKGKISPDEFLNIIEKKDCSKVNFAVPAHGLYLKKVIYNSSILNYIDS